MPLGETALRRCIENVVSNALRFARTTAAVSLRAVDGEVELTVEDDGLGLPDQAAFANVWNRGARYHVADGKSGTGLGLSIVKGLVEAAGGSVSRGQIYCVRGSALRASSADRAPPGLRSRFSTSCGFARRSACFSPRRAS